MMEGSYPMTFSAGGGGGGILFYGHGLKFFHPLEVPSLKQNIISCRLFSAQYLKRYCKSSGRGPLEAEHRLTDTKTAFLS